MSAPFAAARPGVVHDAAGRTFHDGATGEVLVEITAWDCAGDGERAQARARLAVVRHAEDLIAQGLPRLDADARAAAQAGLKPSAVGAWRRKVQGLPEGVRVIALLDQRRSGRPSVIEGAVRDYLEALLYEYGPHLTSRQACDALEARFDDPPARSTVRKWLHRMREQKAHALSAVLDPDRHRSHRKPAGGNASAAVTALNQLWELDSTLADVICADGKRYAIVSCIDVWSRRARVLVAPTSRATAIAALLRRCIIEWGVPETVRTDEGKDYTSAHVVGVFDDLGIRHDRCLPYTPEAKPHIERFLGTLARERFALLPGFTGHDVAQAQALRARRGFAERHVARNACGSNGPSEPARVIGVGLTVEQLQEDCDAWCRAIYERRGHAGLDGATPFDRAKSWTGVRREVYDVRALDALLAEPAGTGWRTVNKKGVRLGKLDYIAGPLGRLVKERVHIRRDPADPGRIHVYLPSPDGPERRGAFVCVAVCPALTGDDQAEIAGRMTAEWKGARREARKRARDLKRRYRPERAADEILAKAIAESDRVVALPLKGTAHETPALTQAARAARAADEADALPQPAAGAKPSLAATALRLFSEEEDEWQK